MFQEVRKEIGKATKNYFLPITLLWKLLFCRQKVVSAIIINSKGGILLVKKRCSEYWILPGGKRLPTETYEQCLERELGEELPIFSYFGMNYYKTFWGQAPRSGYPIIVVTYSVECFPHGNIKPGAEIEESVWAETPLSFKLNSVTKRIILSLMKKGKL